MRYCFVLCLVFFFGCSKNTAKKEDPKCQLAAITKAGYAYYPLTYNGTKIVQVGADSSTSSVLRYDNTGKLSTVELPLKNPNDKTELFYNSEGKVSMEKHYQKYGDNWQEIRTFFYTYSNGKMTAIKETIPWTNPSSEYDYEVIWDGDNIRTIIIRSGITITCTQQYSYDITQKNPMVAFADLYYGDNLKYSFKKPLFLSANLLIKEETNCPSVQTTNLTYEFKDSLLQKISTNGNPLLAYTYECR